jgi:ribosomal protein L37AE/L43A
VGEGPGADAGAERVTMHERFTCPGCGRLQYDAHPSQGTGYKKCGKCGTTWFYAVVPVAPQGVVFLGVVCTPHEAHLYRLRPNVELLRALGVLEKERKAS